MRASARINNQLPSGSLQLYFPRQDCLPRRGHLESNGPKRERENSLGLISALIALRFDPHGREPPAQVEDAPLVR